jgi:hypothetical protein
LTGAEQVHQRAAAGVGEQVHLDAQAAAGAAQRLPVTAGLAAPVVLAEVTGVDPPHARVPAGRGDLRRQPLGGHIPRWLTAGTGGVLMSAHDGRVDGHRPLALLGGQIHIAGGAQRVQHPVPGPVG